MLTPEQSRAYEVLSVGAVNETGYSRTSEGSGSVGSRGLDGDRFNNELINLQILCPNCHALTDNYSGRNKGN